MYRFFVDKEQIGPENVYITGQDVNHIKNVLRMKPGEVIRISDGEARDYLCEIAELSETTVTAAICEKLLETTELPAKIYLFQGLPKGDKMELIIQKAVELGVCEIIPVATKRAVVKLDAKKEESKRKRWQGIAESAAKQSKRLMIPKIHPALSFKEALAYAADMEKKLLPYENAEGIAATRKALAECEAGMRIAVFIGPEGGFDETEVEEAFASGFQPLTLGRRILRTETAGLTMLSLLMVQLES